MRQAADIIQFQTRGRGMFDITRTVADWVDRQAMTTGLLSCLCRHTSAGLQIQENASPDVRADLEDFLAKIAPESGSRYRHFDEGVDDMPAHLRTVLTGVTLSIPLIEGKLALGTWQGIYLYEHRRQPHARQVALHVAGE